MHKYLNKLRVWRGRGSWQEGEGGAKKEGGERGNREDVVL